MAGRKRKPGSGRHPALTDDVKRIIVAAVVDGNPMRIAACAAGLAERTVARYLKIGRESKSGIYWQFLQEVKKAEAECALKNLALIQKAAETDPKYWGASSWILSRRFPADWGDSQKEIKELSKKLSIAEGMIRELLKRLSPKNEEAGASD